MTNVRDATKPLVILVDDDPGLLEAMGALFRSVGLETVSFVSTDRLLEYSLPDRDTCLVLDVRLPGVGGLEFNEQLIRSGRKMSVVFITGHGDIPMTVRAMKAGAVDFLAKPFRDQDLLDAVNAALTCDKGRRERNRQLSDLVARRQSLSPRESQVFEHVVAGLLNKQIAAEVGLQEITVKIYRGNLMRKMGARSVAELVKMAETLKLDASVTKA